MQPANQHAEAPNVAQEETTMRHVMSPAVLALCASFMSSLALAQTSSDPGNSGWGQAGSNNLYAGASFLNGQRPDQSSSGPERYQRIQSWLCYQAYGYYDKTRFDTLVGGEISAGFGYVTRESANPRRSPEPSDNWTRVPSGAMVAARRPPVVREDP
jgi:hypothetical protein